MSELNDDETIKLICEWLKCWMSYNMWMNTGNIYKDCICGCDSVVPIVSFFLFCRSSSMVSVPAKGLDDVDRLVLKKRNRILTFMVFYRSAHSAENVGCENWTPSSEPQPYEIPLLLKEEESEEENIYEN